jgi:hypothetical protein
MNKLSHFCVNGKNCAHASNGTHAGEWDGASGHACLVVQGVAGASIYIYIYIYINYLSNHALQREYIIPYIQMCVILLREKVS